MHSHYQEIKFLSFKDKKGSLQHRIDIIFNDVPVSIAKGLPLVGEELAENALLLEDLRLIMASADANEMKGKAEEDFAKGLTLSGAIRVGGEHQPFGLNLGRQAEPKSKDTALLPSRSYEKLPEVKTSTSLNNTKNEEQLASSEGFWLDIQKSLGPITLSRLGIDYRNTKIWLLLDAEFNNPVLTISLNGLGAGLSINSLKNMALEDIEFVLKGLGINLQTKVFSIGGSLLRVNDNQYDGSLLIKIGKLTITALGSYAKEGKDTSLFAFAALDYPLGGPPCFFITGGAIGFGYNRDLISPSINDIHEFPLIKAAITHAEYKNKTPTAMVSAMTGVVPHKTGQYWAAAGIKFKSFEFVTGFVLASVTFGKRTEINLLGTAVLEVGTKEAPIAFVQLNIKCSLIPEEGVFSLEAAIASNSYLLSRECHLIGGFAFYVWFGNSIHAGDFVITLGGYHPDYKVPSHYPMVPRVGLNWQVDRSLVIKGELYFALTPACLMFGGRLQALFNMGRVQAYFDMYLDALIAWKPVYYDIKIGILIAGRVNLSFWSPSFCAAADLNVWGPDFSGKAKISLSFISFSIEFGGNSKKPGPIEWEEFQSILSNDVNKICDISVSNGLLQEVKDKEGRIEYIIVDPEEFEFTASSLIPISEVRIAGLSEADTKASKIGLINKNINNNFGIGMVGIKKLDSVHEISIELNNKLISENVQYTYTTAKVASALWSADNNPENTIKNGTIDNMLTAVSYGFDTNVPDETLDIEMFKLLFNLSQPEQLEIFKEYQIPNVAHKNYDWHNFANQTQNVSNSSSLLKPDISIDLTSIDEETYFYQKPIICSLGREVKNVC